VNQVIGRQMLMRAGCDDVVIANHGAQALEMWGESSFDVILMDYHVRRPLLPNQLSTERTHARTHHDEQMPVMDGLEATKRIRERERDLGVGRTPIIALSASLDPSERELGASAGMDDWCARLTHDEDDVEGVQG
jgi:CheY-like chemotaxis protein